MKKIVMTVALATIASTSLADVKPFEAVEYRKGIFKAVKWQFGPIADMVKGKRDFNAEEMASRATNLAALSKMPLDGFRAGTYARATSALPVIEEKWEEFAGLMGKFETNTAALAEAAQSGDLQQIKPAFITVAKTCKACHDQFKD